VQFHDDTFQGFESRRDFNEAQLDWLIRAKQASRGDSGSKEYPIWPAAPVTAIFMENFIRI
jgi:hypothetical protein